MSIKKRNIYILLGPCILLVTSLLLSNYFGYTGSLAIGTLFWMVFWWISRPFDITITALVPVVINAVLNLVPMSNITSLYASDSIILIFGSGLLCLPWSKIGLDKRVALKALSLIGPSIASQVTVWLLAATILSTAMPNVAVCALLCPIAVSMLHAAGQEDITNSAAGTIILLCIGWGAGIGGAGSPLGGAMNLAAISYIEAYTGSEFMYVDWIIRMAPYFILGTLLLWSGLLFMSKKVGRLDGSKDYFITEYKKLGVMKKEEKICATLFMIATIGSFTRPLYTELLPALVPAYLFLILGMLSFVITTSSKEVLVTWKEAQENLMWGMMILIAGGLALGQLIVDSGASIKVVELIMSLSLDGGLLTIIVFVVIGRVLSEITTSTTSASVVIPIVLSFALELGMDPIPLCFVAIMGYNAEFVLPISVRAIPVGFGLNPNKMVKGGLAMTTLNVMMVIIVSYIAINYWPLFSAPLL